MTSSRREQIIGFQLGETSAQITVCQSTMKEPVTLGEDDNTSAIPVPPGVWKELSGESEDCPQLTDFFRESLERGGLLAYPEDVRIMVTVRKLRPGLWDRIPAALEKLGIPRRYIFLQDYDASFFYYAVHQRRELWNGDVVLMEYRGGVMSGRLLHIDRTKTPALATVTEAARDVIGDESLRGGRTDAAWDQERDRQFFELLKKVFERRNVVTCYLLGSDFDRSWAVRSFQYLCQRRHAFQGENLYTRGACHAAMERMGLSRTPELLFLGDGIVRENLGMQMRVRGREMYYPLVSAGTNWYEVHHECEVIPETETDLVLVSKPMSGGYEVSHILHMDHFPKRPPRMTRLRLSVYFISPRCAVVETEGLGFGGFYRPSGRRWNRRIYLQTRDEGEAGGTAAETEGERA